MGILKVTDIIGSGVAVSPRKGLLAFDSVASLLSKEETVILDFEGITDMTSAFCNSFIGKLYMTFEPKVLAARLSFNGIAEMSVWDRKIKNAILLGTNENARTLHKLNLDDIILS